MRMSLPDPGTRRGKGCLGGCLLPLAGLLVAGAVLVLVALAVFTPWAFYLGGHFHPVPAWAGVGRVHASSGDFTLYVSLQPTSQSRQLGIPRVSGTAMVVDPKGEKFLLNIAGGFTDRWVGLVPEGRAMFLDFHRYYRGISLNAPERRPRFDLHGRWRGPILVMTDHGSFSRAFLPDGRAWLGPRDITPATRETLNVSLRPCGWWEYTRATAFSGAR